MSEDICLEYNGRIYGEYDIIADDITSSLRKHGFKTRRDVSIKETKYGANPKAMREWCDKHKRTMLTVLIGMVPFYFAVDGNEIEIENTLKDKCQKLKEEKQKCP